MKDKIETINNMIDYFTNRLSQGYERYDELIYKDAVELLQNIKIVEKTRLNSLYGYQVTESLKTKGFTGGFTQPFIYFKTYSNVDIIVMCEKGEEILRNVDVIEYDDYLKVLIENDEFINFYKDKIVWFQIRKHKEKIIKENKI